MNECHSPTASKDRWLRMGMGGLRSFRQEMWWQIGDDDDDDYSLNWAEFNLSFGIGINRVRVSGYRIQPVSHQSVS